MNKDCTHYLSPSSKHWVIDIETDDLDATKVWVCCVQNVVTKEKRTLTSDAEIKQWFSDHRDCYFIGHNILQFDGPVLNRLCDTGLIVGRLVDTLLLSMLYSPHLTGGHSLDAWGERIKLRKDTFNDWSHLSDEMIKYCEQDVEVCLQVFLRLTERMRKLGFTNLGAQIEHRAWFLASKQQKTGFYFAEKDAHLLLAELTGVHDDLTSRIRRRFPAEEKLYRKFSKSHKADGTPAANYSRHLAQYHRIETYSDGTYAAFQLVDFNIGSPNQRVEKLLELGWVPGPTERTPKGSPSPTRKGELAPSLARFAEDSGVEEVQLIAQWMAINGRINALKDWINKVGPDSRIHGNMWLAGSLRYRHDKPNTANIPAVPTNDGAPVLGLAGLYKYEARDLWRCSDPKTRNLVGVDAAGIQLRVLAHYLNDVDYTNTILFGKSEDGTDIHTRNQKITGIRTRDQTKTFTYAVLLGAGDAKVGEICGVSTREGGGIKRRFIEGVPGLRRLYQRLEQEFERTGRITLCDGSLVIVPNKNAILAYLLQGDESRIMKTAWIFMDAEVRKQKLDVDKVGDIHDEWQNDVLIEHTDPFVAVCHDSFKKAGEFFNYNLPIECNAKIGKTWAETH